jgi:hypothetical protein
VSVLPDALAAWVEQQHAEVRLFVGWAQETQPGVLAALADALDRQQALTDYRGGLAVSLAERWTPQDAAALEAARLVEVDVAGPARDVTTDAHRMLRQTLVWVRGLDRRPATVDEDAWQWSRAEHLPHHIAGGRPSDRYLVKARS